MSDSERRLRAHLARGATLLATLALLAGCSPRAPAPPFTYALLDGRLASSDTLRGKVTLVNFWATSCAICVGEMPKISAAYEKFKPRGFRTLAVAMSYDAPANVADYAESRHLPFDVVIDNTGAIAQRFGPIEGTPTAFLIDRNGVIVKRWVGEPDFAALDALVERLLGDA